MRYIEDLIKSKYEETLLQMPIHEHRFCNVHGQSFVIITNIEYQRLLYLEKRAIRLTAAMTLPIDIDERPDG